MDISQTSVTEGKDEPAKKDDQTDQPSGGYYYDDTTGYEIYDGEDEPEEEDGADTESSQDMAHYFDCGASLPVCRKAS